MPQIGGRPGHYRAMPRHGPFSSVLCRAWAGPKSPCLGPAHLATYTDNRSWIRDGITSLITTFYRTGIMPAHLNDTHIALIPKKLKCHLPSDFRPISLCNVIYKVIAKSLANRLKPHLPNYIHPSQQAFIQGRRISNNIIIAQEIAHFFSLFSFRSHDFMLKIDLAKAFDRLEWNFITTALARKCLHGHFIKLINACISTPTFFCDH